MKKILFLIAISLISACTSTTLHNKTTRNISKKEKEEYYSKILPNSY